MSSRSSIIVCSALLTCRSIDPINPSIHASNHLSSIYHRHHFHHHPSSCVSISSITIAPHHPSPSHLTIHHHLSPSITICTIGHQSFIIHHPSSSPSSPIITHNFSSSYTTHHAHLHRPSSPDRCFTALDDYLDGARHSGVAVNDDRKEEIEKDEDHDKHERQQVQQLDGTERLAPFRVCSSNILVIITYHNILVMKSSPPFWVWPQAPSQASNAWDYAARNPIWLKIWLTNLVAPGSSVHIRADVTRLTDRIWLHEAGYTRLLFLGSCEVTAAIKIWLFVTFDTHKKDRLSVTRLGYAPTKSSTPSAQWAWGYELDTRIDTCAMGPYRGNLLSSLSAATAWRSGCCRTWRPNTDEPTLVNHSSPCLGHMPCSLPWMMTRYMLHLRP